MMNVNLLLNQDENYYYENRKELICWANTSIIEQLDLYNYSLKLKDYNIITDEVSYFPC